MTGPSWLAATFAAVMILVAVFSASRLAVCRLRGRATEFDADALHVFMAAAMAGMLMPRLNVLPDSTWMAVFGIAAAWFGWHAVRARGLATSGSAPRRFPVPHLIECAAMFYMLLPVQGPRPGHGRAGMAMAGMGASTGPAGGFPALAIVLALFMVGYIVWTTDRLATLARVKPIAPDPATNPDRQSPAPVLAAAPSHGPFDGPGTPGAPGTRPGDQAGMPVLAPKLAACGRLAMSITMGYMLILTF